jgi:predicted ATPase
MPEEGEEVSVEMLARYDAVALFTTRSRAVNPHFVLNRENAATIAAICRRLDGLPLAIELAAARSKLLSAPALLARLTGALGSRLAFLVDRNRNLAERHQTLRATLAWSYALLAPPEQALLQQLAVFVGSFSYEAVEAVCGQEADSDVLAGLEILVDNSLLDRVESDLPASSDARYDELRFHMLSIIRDYALELFEQSPAADEVRQHHAAFFLDLAHQAEPHLQGGDQLLWLNRLDLERENWRAALAWSSASLVMPCWGWSWPQGWAPFGSFTVTWPRVIAG